MQKAKKTIIITISLSMLLVVIVVSLFSAILSPLYAIKDFFTENGTQSVKLVGGKKEIGSKVLKHKDLIEKYANKYGITEYVPLIAAIMMQEAPPEGDGVNVMQVNAGASSVEDSIDKGVSIIKSLITEAGVTSPTDMANIYIAVQSYNFGSGYIKYAKEAGGWSKENALAFQKYQSGGKMRDKSTDSLYQNAGPYAYGDAYYVEHVMQYYSVDESLFATQKVNSIENAAFSIESMYSFVSSNMELSKEQKEKFKNGGIAYKQFKHIIDVYQEQFDGLSTFTIEAEKLYKIYDNKGKLIETKVVAEPMAVGDREYFKKYLVPWQYVLYMYLSSDVAEVYNHEDGDSEEGDFHFGFTRNKFIDDIYKSYSFIPYYETKIEKIVSSEHGKYTWSELGQLNCEESYYEVATPENVLGDKYKDKKVVCTVRTPVSKLSSAETMYGDLYFDYTRQPCMITGYDFGEKIENIGSNLVTENNIGYNRDFMMVFMEEANFSGACQDFIDQINKYSEAAGPIGTGGNRIGANGSSDGSSNNSDNGKDSFPEGLNYTDGEVDLTDSKYITHVENGVKVYGLENIKLTDITSYAVTWVGFPYVYGATDPNRDGAMDCSAFVMKVIKETRGVQLDRTSRAQFADNVHLKNVTKPQAGDLVFWKKNDVVNHVGIYLGNEMVVAESWEPAWPRGGCKIHPMYYSSNDGQVFAGFKRLK
ncbi:MAG: bifunctional lysozyme/C40 family peptidase [Lachnospiraceae bacterium]|nr:bifunctional lysozyme/C40 family peptidase [Lachnospiraceae bacterium]